MSNETRNGGTPSGGRAPISEAELETLRADEQRQIAFFHVDAGRALADLARDSVSTGRGVEQVGVDAMREERIQLQRKTALIFRLLELQFTDLDP